MSQQLPNLHYSDTRTIEPSAIIHLREQVGWDPATTEVWADTLATARHVASAWDGEQLVGIGFLIGSRRHAMPCDLAVAPGYQRQGIGRRLVEDLIAAARKQEIKYITLTYNDQKPWLKAFYHSFGFVPIGNAMQLQTQHPKS